MKGKGDEPNFRDYVLAELRAARVRAKMLVKEIETIGIALRANVIEPVTAIEWMHEAFMLRFLQPETNAETIDGYGADVGESVRASEARPADGADGAAAPGGP